VPDGRFAPSPTGDLHLGNLRTAMLAWLFARSTGSRFVVRMEDLDRVRSSGEHEARQLSDLAALGVDHDGEIVRQSERFDHYGAAIETLTAAGLTYPCYCTRREIREAVAAPHDGAPGEEGLESAYPGTCRELSTAQRAELEASGRPPALRLRGDHGTVRIVDAIHGEYEAVVDDVVLRRNDGVPAYNLAVVIDDDLQRIGQVVRADDLLSSTPRQVHLIRLLGLTEPTYAHVPLVVAPDGSRLAKRHGAVSLTDLATIGVGVDRVRSILAASVGLAELDEPVGMPQLIERFHPERLPRHAWTFRPESLQETPQ